METHNLLLEATGAGFFIFGGFGRFVALQVFRGSGFSACASVSPSAFRGYATATAIDTQEGDQAPTLIV
jgi:hypothetical protein